MCVSMLFIQNFECIHGYRKPFFFNFEILLEGELFTILYVGIYMRCGALFHFKLRAFNGNKLLCYTVILKWSRVAM